MEVACFNDTKEELQSRTNWNVPLRKEAEKKNLKCRICKNRLYDDTQ